MGPGPLIAIDVVLLYTILGPLVLFGIYVLFDVLSGTGSAVSKKTVNKSKEKPMALWTEQDLDVFWGQD